MTRRPPARRRRRSKRRQREQDQLVALLVGAVIGLAIFIAAVNWLLAHWWVFVLLAVVAVLAGVGALYQRQQRALWARTQWQGLRYGLPQLDGLHHRDFEYAIRDLMRRDGCTDAKQIGGAGDNGADVLATDPLGRKWVIQCKHRRNGAQGSAVGTPDLQRVNGTARQLYGADVVLVVTNGRFSTKCPELARQLRMHLADRTMLASWAAGSRPLWELLPKVPPPRRSTPLR
ncbi:MULTISPECIES: restriction endonuclease [unclassified Streptomyces]|uniref:restriction endonuclease n=1 Tax=unclassified Streptomyces TaxID=2593676 RepID=UPI00224CFDAF|nr:MULTISPECIES: restriction endonuclease [unclassified Streptomyces]MCX5443742.1 restriction endonuclease [Streptomyces sp. NBC_00063]WUB90917.1 restriction endonuclease [Streptomyces sp. NBC_00569]WUB99122.1 restriction endonuclease [Streptomyces sp. NBC_00569]